MAQLTITPSSSNLGTITNDIQYTVTSDTAGTLTASIMVNDAIFAQQSLTSGTSSSILITQLPTGENTITLTATLTESGGGATTQTATWQYTKTPIAFPTAGSVADLSVNGQTVLPTTLAEAVRTSPVWGGSLDLALQSLSNAALYKTTENGNGLFDIQNNLLLSLPGVQIATGSYTGTGTSGASNKVVLRLPFPAKALFVSMVPVISGSGDYDYYEIMFLKGNQTKEYFSSSKYFAMDAGSARGSLIYVTFDDTQNIVKWYSPNGEGPQLNMSGFVYNYLALG